MSDIEKVKKLKKLEIDLVAENRGFTKKELLKMSVKRDKLQKSLGGIAKMKKIPDLVFVIDTNYESLAIKESIKLSIPIVAILDTNSDPDGINFPIPGNDDARRAINLYCDLVKQTIIDAQKHISSKEQIESSAQGKENEDHKKLKPKELKSSEKKVKAETSEKKPLKEKKNASIFSKLKKLTSKK